MLLLWELSRELQNFLQRGEEMFDEFAHLKITSEKLDWAAERMIGMQEDADNTPEIISDYAWLRDDEIYCLAENLFISIKDDITACKQIEDRCEDERWPVRIMFCFTRSLLEKSDLYDDSEKYMAWFENFRDSDPDPTEP